MQRSTDERTCATDARTLCSRPRVSWRLLWHVAVDLVLGCAFVSRGVLSLVLVALRSLGFATALVVPHRDVLGRQLLPRGFSRRTPVWHREAGTSRVRCSMMVTCNFAVTPTIITPRQSATAVGYALEDKGAVAVLGTTARSILSGFSPYHCSPPAWEGENSGPVAPAQMEFRGGRQQTWKSICAFSSSGNSSDFTYLSMHEALPNQRRRHWHVLHAYGLPVNVKGMNPAPHIHEHLRYTIMATALRTPSRITTSRLSTLR